MAKTSDLDVLPLALGGNVFGWTADRDTSFAVLDAFVDGGGRAIDTADVYSAWVPGNKGGESETVIGNWLKARPGMRRKKRPIRSCSSTSTHWAGAASRSTTPLARRNPSRSTVCSDGVPGADRCAVAGPTYVSGRVAHLAHALFSCHEQH